MTSTRSVLKCLILDDSESDRLLVQRMLRADPEFDVDIQSSETVAEGLAAAQGDGYDLIVVDQEFPDGTGLELLPALRRTAPGAALLFVTGHHDLALAAQAMERGAHHFMFKDELTTSALSHGIRVALERQSKASMRDALKKANVAARTLSRYVPSDLADSVLEPTTDGADIAAHHMHAAVLFGDITGSSQMVESLGADATIGFFSSLFSHLTDDVSAHGGIVDKIVGDGLVALFPARSQTREAIAEAISGALEGGAQAIRSFHDEWNTVPNRDGVRSGFRIGVAYGEVVRGNVGSRERADFTMVGRTVMVAKRLEAMAPNNAVLYQATIHDHIEIPPDATDAGLIALKGVYDLVPAFRIDPLA
jgi:adenylate cyclase